MPFSIVRNDITRLKVDAIVNAANSSLAQGSGVCGAIFHAAGAAEMRKACAAIGHCDVGCAVITPGFALAARYVIHTVGPIWRGGTQGEAELLQSCYRNSLALAQAQGLHSIAFPLISSGIYGYPKDQAMDIAVGTIRDFLLSRDEMDVTLTVFDKGAVLLGQERFASLRSYIDDHYVDKTPSSPRQDAFAIRRQRAEQDGRMAPLSQLPDDPRTARFTSPCNQGPQGDRPASRSLAELVDHLDESFNQMLLRLIDEKGFTDVEVYKRANLDRKLFSKLRHEGYTPSKSTILALAVALRLNADETRDLLARAGYALSPSSKFDVIVDYFIRQETYDIFAINEALFAFDQKLLGA
jgi:O-acetyl-ADP-ribose deacetylase (regulator of RNase III)